MRVVTMARHPCAGTPRQQQGRSMRHIPYKTIITCLIILAVPVVADDEDYLKYQEEVDKALEFMEPERFQFAYQCREVSVHVELIRPANAKKIGVTKEIIETTVRDVLQGAQIYSDASTPGRPLLFVRMEFAESGYYLGAYLVGLAKRDEIIEGEGIVPYAMGDAVTWFRGGLFPPTSVTSIVIHVVIAMTEHFVDEYLRVNAEDCN